MDQGGVVQCTGCGIVAAATWRISSLDQGGVHPGESSKAECVRLLLAQLYQMFRYLDGVQSGALSQVVARQEERYATARPATYRIA